MRIEILCPELCNLYGDMGNTDYLKASLPADTEFIRTGLTQKPAFADEDVDMIYIASMSEKSQERMIEKLRPFKARLENLIEKGVLILATGNAPEIFMDRIEVEDGTVIDALGITPYYSKRKLRERNNSLYMGTFDDPEAGEITIVGYTSRFTFTYGVPESDGLFRNIKGDGNEPESSVEGFSKGGLVCTNLLGPLLVLNPDFMKYILRRLGAGDCTPAFYDDAKKAYEVRLNEFRGDIDFGTHC
ncbi:MAG: hypothetical protein E7220_01515 [Clostridiales bacterium]|nr:hypothetical protein [Clostridiales bacterium]